MPKLKFKIWDKQKKRYLSEDDHSLHCQSNWVICPFSGEVVDFTLADNNYSPSFYGCDRFEIQQYIGLLDCEGKEIYEGDTVECKCGEHIYTAKVVYSTDVLGFVLDTSGRHLIDDKYGDFLPMRKQYTYKIKNQ
jgi:uncharacterized phage protein (TIGR01671 family)